MNSQNTTSFPMQAQSGSSLIGVAILTLVMGFLMTGAIYLMQNYDVIHSDQDSINTTKTVQKAIDTFITVEGRYPCPAVQGIAPDLAGFGIENCAASISVAGRAGNVRIGDVPVRTLNIPDNMIVDGYGKRHIYAITESMTIAGADLENGLGDIFIRDERNTSEGSISKADGFVIYALLSPGEDDRGAYDLQGGPTPLQPCDTGELAGENCDFMNPATADAIFISTSEKIFRGEDNDFTHSFAFKASSLDYNWETSTWSECGAYNAAGDEWDGARTLETNTAITPAPPVCFSSYQTRTVECRDKQNTLVPIANEEDEDRCGHTTKPIPDRTCTLGPCTWRVGSTCS